MPAYLKIGDIKGEVQDARYKGWIALESVSFGSNRPQGRVSGTERVFHFVSDIGITMMSGKPTAKMVQAATEGRHLGDVIIVLDGGGDPERDYALVLKDVVITSYQSGPPGQGSTLPIDSFSLNATKVTYVYGAEVKSLQEKTPEPSKRR
jgi:type VI secretion system secreted protein Hcp